MLSVGSSFPRVPTSKSPCPETRLIATFLRDRTPKSPRLCGPPQADLLASEAPFMPNFFGSEAPTIMQPAAGGKISGTLSVGSSILYFCYTREYVLLTRFLPSDLKKSIKNFRLRRGLPTWRNAKKVLPTLNPGNTPPPREGVSVKLYTLRRTSGSHNLQVGTPMVGWWMLIFGEINFPIADWRGVGRSQIIVDHRKQRIGSIASF